MVFKLLFNIPPERGYGIIKQMWSIIDHGGALSIHFPIYRDRRHLQEIVRDVDVCTYDGNKVEVLRSDDASHPGAMSMYDYDFSRVISCFDLQDGARMLVEHVDHGGCHGVKLYLFKQ